MRDASAWRDAPGVPMVVRRVAPERIDTARTVLSDDSRIEAGDVWWELVDPAGDMHGPPAGVAVTRLDESGIAYGRRDGRPRPARAAPCGRTYG